jgi:galactokinase
MSRTELSVSEYFRKQFGTRPEVITSAPGRLEILGNHLDHTGGSVVGAAIDRRLYVAIARRSDARIRLASDVMPDSPAYTSITDHATDAWPDWAAYPLGIVNELLVQGMKLGGFDLAIASDIPAGAGLSSSAALETATALALSQAFGLYLDRSVIAALSQRAENRFVGVPCGLLDQTVVTHAQPEELVVFDSALQRHHTIRLPAGTRLLVAQSHVQHRLAESPYEQRVNECLGAAMSLERYIPGMRNLAELHPLDVAVYGHVLEPVLARRARHITEESERVQTFLDALSRDDQVTAGALLSASHESSRTLFENSIPELDALVATLTAFRGVSGARLTGAGWGGSVLAWCPEGIPEGLPERLKATYMELFDAELQVWDTGLSDGLRSESATS